MPGCIFANPDSGPDETRAGDLRARFAPHTVDECPPDELTDRAAAALANRPDFVGVAGGDGSQSTVAAVLAGTGVPLLPIPAGTRNHFARDLGVPDLDTAARAAHGTRIRRVDLGRVGDRHFVNNASVGAYADLVREREYHERHRSKRVATVVATYRVLRRGRAVDLRLDDAPVKAWLVFVGNGCYGEGVFDLTSRESLDEHVLDVRVIRADRRFVRLRVLGSALLGRLASSRVVEHRRATSLHVADRTGRTGEPVDVAIDGEVETRSFPLVFESAAGALSVLVPPPGPGEAA